MPLPPDRTPGVLIVDDDAGVRGLLAAALPAQGFAVWTAEGGREAVEVYRRHGAAIDLVLLDVMMPEIDGPATLDALRQIDRGVRHQFMSGYAGGHGGERLGGWDGSALLGKPFRLGEVAEAVRRAVA